MANTPQPSTAKEQTDQVRYLFNNVLYVLQHSTFRGEDSHLVELSKQFIKEMKNDFELRAKADVKADAPVEAKPEASSAV